MKRVIIFGACGFVGPYLAQEFLDNGYEVFASDIIEKRIKKDITFFQANLLNSSETHKVIHSVKPSIIVNLAAISSVKKSWEIPQETVSVNTIGTLNILEASKTLSPLPKILLIGSSEEYAISYNPINENTPLQANNPYGISKVAQERFASIYRIQYGMQIYYVRPFNHTGVGQPDSFVLSSFCKQAASVEKSGKPGIIKTGNLLIRRDFGHIKDLVNAYRLIVESPYCDTVYNIGSGIAYSLRELLNYVISLCSQPIEIITTPERVRPIDNPYICCDASKIKKELGWKPTHTVFDALKEMFEYYSTN